MRLLIVNNNMQIGGIQKALLNMLRAIADEYDVTLLLFNPAGALMKDIPQSVRVVHANWFVRIMGMSNAEAKAKGVFTYIWRSVWAVVARIWGIKHVYRNICNFQKLDQEFDAAISYMQNSGNKIFYGGCNEFVLNSVKAKKKLAFLHCDFKHYFGNNEYNRSLYKKFDNVVCVSDSCRRVFAEVCPGIADKAVTAHNFHDIEGMMKSAEEYTPELEQGFNIFTSARLHSEKGIMRVIPMIARLKAKGYDVNWYVAGDGEEWTAAVRLSEKLGADVHFLGLLENPYPYFKAADLVLVPSYNEAAPMVYAEAMCFGTPILTTDTTSAKELVKEFGAGWVEENTDLALEEALEKILSGRAEQLSVTADLEGLNMMADAELKKIFGVAE